MENLNFSACAQLLLVLINTMSGNETRSIVVGTSCELTPSVYLKINCFFLIKAYMKET